MPRTKAEGHRSDIALYHYHDDIALCDKMFTQASSIWQMERYQLAHNGKGELVTLRSAVCLAVVCFKRSQFTSDEATPAPLSSRSFRLPKAASTDRLRLRAIKGSARAKMPPGCISNTMVTLVPSVVGSKIRETVKGRGPEVL